MSLQPVNTNHQPSALSRREFTKSAATLPFAASTSATSFLSMLLSVPDSSLGVASVFKAPGATKLAAFAMAFDPLSRELSLKARSSHITAGFVNRTVAQSCGMLLGEGVEKIPSERELREGIRWLEANLTVERFNGDPELLALVNQPNFLAHALRQGSEERLERFIETLRTGLIEESKKVITILNDVRMIRDRYQESFGHLDSWRMLDLIVQQGFSSVVNLPAVALNNEYLKLRASVFYARSRPELQAARLAKFEEFIWSARASGHEFPDFGLQNLFTIEAGPAGLHPRPIRLSKMVWQPEGCFSGTHRSIR